MSEDHIRYDILASDALRGIIRTVLQRVQKKRGVPGDNHGLPGDHHFYITFDTNAPGTIISKRLQQQYPEEMTIVLQHRFWDLMVYDDRFEVKLSFNTVPERLVVPFAAIKSFVDPSVSFGFSPNVFASASARPNPVPTAQPPADTPESVDRAALPRSVSAGGLSSDREIEIEITQEETPLPHSAEVVKLDMFRKK
jgi:hypothetical protein